MSARKPKKPLLFSPRRSSAATCFSSAQSTPSTSTEKRPRNALKYYGFENQSKRNSVIESDENNGSKRSRYDNHEIASEHQEVSNLPPADKTTFNLAMVSLLDLGSDPWIHSFPTNC